MSNAENITIARAAKSIGQDRVVAIVGSTTLSIVRDQSQTQYTDEVQYVVYRVELVKGRHTSYTTSTKQGWCDVSAETGARKWARPFMADKYGPALDAAMNSTLWT